MSNIQAFYFPGLAWALFYCPLNVILLKVQGSPHTPLRPLGSGSMLHSASPHPEKLPYPRHVTGLPESAIKHKSQLTGPPGA
jgi:hypothetical protein